MESTFFHSTKTDLCVITPKISLFSNFLNFSLALALRKAFVRSLRRRRTPHARETYRTHLFLSPTHKTSRYERKNSKQEKSGKLPKKGKLHIRKKINFAIQKENFQIIFPFLYSPYSFLVPKCTSARYPRVFHPLPQKQH